MKPDTYTSQNQNQKSRLFFLEFLIVLFFFLIISTVCIRLFVQARKTSDSAEELARAQTLAASAAEILIAEQGDFSFLQEQYASLFDSGVIHLTADSSEHLTNFHIQIKPKDFSSTSESVYDLSLTLHVPLTRREVLP